MDFGDVIILGSGFIIMVIIAVAVIRWILEGM